MLFCVTFVITGILIFEYVDKTITLDLNKNDFQSSNSLVSPVSNDSNPAISIGDPNYQERTLLYNNTDEAGFVLYEDFPILLDNISMKDLNSMKIVGVSDNDIWEKIIRNDTKSNSSSQMILRVLGAVKPFKPNSYNQTLFIVMTDSAHQTYVGTIPLLRTKIMSESSILNTELPIKFKNEIFALKNSTFPHIFGIVYDPSYPLPFLEPKDVLSSIRVDITPMGIMNNTVLSPIPSWLTIRPLQLPLTLNPDQPDYFSLLISTKNAPLGSYEIVLHETINKKIFTETITLSIVG